MTRDTIKPHDHPDIVGGWVWTKLEMRWIEERIAEAVSAEREAMVAEAAKQGWAMKNEDPFEDAVREIAAIRARGQA